MKFSPRGRGNQWFQKGRCIFIDFGGGGNFLNSGEESQEFIGGSLQYCHRNGRSP